MSLAVKVFESSLLSRHSLANLLPSISSTCCSHRKIAKLPLCNKDILAGPCMIGGHGRIKLLALYLSEFGVGLVLSGTLSHDRLQKSLLACTKILRDISF